MLEGILPTGAKKTGRFHSLLQAQHSCCNTQGFINGKTARLPPKDSLRTILLQSRTKLQQTITLKSINIYRTNEDKID
jgi:hypothetical protein